MNTLPIMYAALIGSLGYITHRKLQRAICALARTSLNLMPEIFYTSFSIPTEDNISSLPVTKLNIFFTLIPPYACNPVIAKLIIFPIAKVIGENQGEYLPTSSEYIHVPSRSPFRGTFLGWRKAER